MANKREKIKDIRTKMERVEPAEGKKEEKEEGEGGEGKEEEKREAEAEERLFREELKEKKSEITREYKETVYEKFADTEKFTMEGELKDDVDAVFDWRRDEIIEEDGRKFLEEKVKEGDSRFVGLKKEDIKKLSGKEVKNKVKDIEEFWNDVIEKDESWKRIVNLSERMKAEGGDSNAEVKSLVFKELYDELSGYEKRYEQIKDDPAKIEETQELEVKMTKTEEACRKVFEKMKGENLDEIAKREAGIGEQEKYQNEKTKAELGKRDDYLKDDEGRKWMEFCKKSKLLLGEEGISLQEWRKMGSADRDEWGSKFDAKIDGIKKRLEKGYPKKMMTVNEKRILALMNAGYNVEDIKLKGLLSNTVELKKIDGTIDKVGYKEFSEFVEGKIKDYETKIEEEAKKGLEEEWDKKFIEKGIEWKKLLDEEKVAILGDAARSEKWKLIEDAYNDLERDVEIECIKEIKRKHKGEWESVKEHFDGKTDKVEESIEEMLKFKVKEGEDWQEAIKRFLEKKMLISTGDEEFGNFVSGLEKRGISWEQAKKEGGIGIFRLLWELVSSILKEK